MRGDKVNKAKTAVIVGAQWGDEGKGKIVDVLSDNFDLVARYGGGHNAGHTVAIGKTKFILQLIPCGILRDGCKAVIGNGLVLDPMALMKEIRALRAAGVRVEGSGASSQPNLFVSNRAHVILPYHRMIELASENAPGRVKIGTTSRGIGPTYEDKMGRRGLRIADLLDKQLLKKHIENACREKNTIAHALFNSEPLDPAKMFDEFAQIADEIAPFVADTVRLLNLVDSRRQIGDVRGRAGNHAGHRPWDLSVRDLFQLHGWRRDDGHRSRSAGHRHRDRHHQGILHAGGRGTVPQRDARCAWARRFASAATSTAR